MPILSPSILSADFANLQRDLQLLEESGAGLVHVDIMDGLFVPNISIGIPVVEAVRRSTKLPLDVHLMITRPIRYVQRFVQAGADFVTVHVEADTRENIEGALDAVHAAGAKAGIVLKPGTPAEAALPFLKKCDMVLVMTVEPGFGGQKFMADQMPKVARLRSWLDAQNPACLLEVDGGVDLTTAPVCKESGADVLVAGSAFFKAADKAAFAAAIQA